MQKAIYMNKMEKGFTLIELLLYISLLSIILFSMVTFLMLIFESRVKNQAILEIESQGAQILSQVTQNIRNADSINSPTAGNTDYSLSLDVYTAGNDPTIFDLFSGKIRIKEGAGANKDLSNSNITASTLTFKNLSRGSTPGIITFQFTLSYKNPSGRNEYNYSKTFYGSGSLR